MGPTNSQTDYFGRGRQENCGCSTSAMGEDQSSEEKVRQRMAKRNLRVTKWLAMTPAIGVCTACNKEFKGPMAALAFTKLSAISVPEIENHSLCRERDLLVSKAIAKSQTCI
jgi:hypothetical protein